MTEHPADNTPRGWLRALYDWATGTVTPPPSLSPSMSASPSRNDVPARIGHYVIDRKLGQGGMGVVYAARDERLERTVALKLMSSMGDDDTARRRFWREARAAASVNHPNICQIYEIGEDGELFIAMELLEGEPLSARLRHGPLAVSDATAIGLAVLAALAALHARGIVHRDLKPSNVFLTAHGVKLLDFGLARPAAPELARSLDSDGNLTQTGMLIGSPGYMAPEQLTGEALDARTDLFAVGAILFEMLAGQPAFSGHNFIDTMHATLHEQPPALSGSPAVAALDRVIRRALAKHLADRPESADAMADELRAVQGRAGDDAVSLARPLTRLVVLPFRVLRPDPETDFLAFSLPDAIATSLSGISSLVIRSSATAARFAGETPDLKALAVEAGVDRIVMGTLVRAGDQVRASAQLVEAPGGTLLTSHTVQASLGDLFRLQDDLARRVVEALALPLGRPETSPMPHAPRDPRAYEFYLRGNELARRYDQLPQARDLYQQCLEIDPSFAPAWAQLGRCHRVIGKYIDDIPAIETRAEEAFRRALELNPRLSVAHKFYAQLEADVGKARQALARLLGEAARHGNDPELFAGLVHVCRYCGLFEQSIAAHEEARRLDPNVPTSVEQTILMTCDIERLLGVEPPPLGRGGDEGIRAIGLGLSGRREEARQLLLAIRSASRLPLFEAWIDYLLTWIEGRGSGLLVNLAGFRGFKIMDDPEAIFQQGWLLCDAGDYERGLSHLQRSVRIGYYVSPTLRTAPAFDAMRGDPVFQALVAEAEAGRLEALATFREAGGERLLGR